MGCLVESIPQQPVLASITPPCILVAWLALILCLKQPDSAVLCCAVLQLPDAQFINALIKLHCRFGVRYIIGLPLFQNAPQLPQAFKALFDAAFKDYPFAIVNYELGNEPNYWPTKAGGFTQINGATTCTSVQQNNPSYQLVGTYDTPADKQIEGYALYRDAQEPYLPYKPQSYCFTPQTTVFAPGIENYNIYFKRAAEALTGVL